MKKLINTNYRQLSLKKGFTVLEAIVAIFVISLAISGAFSSVVQSLSQVARSKEETKAFYLAQEAIESIKQRRDSNNAAIMNTNNPSITWLTGISADPADPCYFDNVCDVNIDSYPPTFIACGTGWDSCPNLLQSGTSYLYNHTAGNNATKILREVQIKRVINNANAIEVTVRVKWDKGEFKVKSFIFNLI